MPVFAARRRPVAEEPSVRLTAAALAAGRCAIGAGIWLAPGPVWRALGLGEPEPRALTVGRLAASRDLLLGVWALAALGDRRRLRRLALATALVDGADAVAFGLALGEGEELREAAVRGLAAAVPATLAGAWMFRKLG